MNVQSYKNLMFSFNFRSVTLISDSLGRALQLPGVTMQMYPGLTISRCMKKLLNGRLDLNYDLIILLVGTNDVGRYRYFTLADPIIVNSQFLLSILGYIAKKEIT